MKYKFPKNFYWGSATSAHQVEGNNHNDWTEWEKKNAERLSKESGGKYPPENYISGRACDHYNRFHEDFDIAKSLGQNAHRFSIEWSRVEPEEGKWNEKEIQHYQELISTLRERQLEPFVTLWHWTLPVWIARQGGWENKKTIDDFARYVDKITQLLNGVDYWITLNEPDIYAMNSYLRGKWPPQRKSFFKFLKVYRHLVKAHNKAYVTIRDAAKERSNSTPSSPNTPKIGIAKNNSYFEGWFALILNYFWNNWFFRTCFFYNPLFCHFVCYNIYYPI